MPATCLAPVPMPRAYRGWYDGVEQTLRAFSKKLEDNDEDGTDGPVSHLPVPASPPGESLVRHVGHPHMDHLLQPHLSRIPATCPPVSMKARGRHWASVSAWILVVRPPRERPIA